MRPERGSDGRWVHTFRQSWLNQFLKCPESARVERVEGLKRPATDKMVRGTAVHAGIEYAILEGAPLAEAIDVAMHELEGLEFEYVDLNPTSMARTIRAMLGGWEEGIRPMLPHETEDLSLVEWSFHVPFYADDERVISLSGTVDYVQDTLCIWDWKTASRPYERWEHQRWAIQPTAYCYAHWVDAGIWLPFRYGVLMESGDAQILDIQRDMRHVEWLRRQVLVIAKMLETNPEGPWPLQDAGWHCSPKWCANFDTCKGEHVRW